MFQNKALDLLWSFLVVGVPNEPCSSNTALGVWWGVGYSLEQH